MSKKSFSGTAGPVDKQQDSDSFLENFVHKEKNEKLKPNQTEKKPLKKEEKLTRQTFMIKESVLDRLKDFVHTKRKYEDYNYSQKLALEEALTTLFDTQEIEERNQTNK